MRLKHFQALRPVCPVCRTESRGDQPLVISQAIRETAEDILEGILLCPCTDCQREFPILDGIPIIVGPLRAYVSDNVLPALMRSDLSEELESLLGDCSGPGSAFDVRRQLLSAYSWDHYGDYDLADAPSTTSSGSIVRNLAESLQLAGPLPSGPVIDMGCSVGRTTFELAEHHDQLALGVDLNFSMLQLASSILRTGRVSYPRRRVGVVYDRREFAYVSSHAHQVDFWACDLLALPFSRQSFSIAVALNVLDCVSAPAEFLHSASGLLNPGGKLILTTPFDWSPAATNVEGWLGGHSQRAVERGASENAVRKLFTEGAPGQIPEMDVIEERDSLPWQVRLHDRASMSYRLSLTIAQKRESVLAISSSEPPISH
ncbi:methyltransferase domain-containing protein [Schlesneria paludicola]|uniref:methyltransferase domain-containing protein n=1 Tax=Schlesneria paludicola TaxID=360056 RepID=UPI00029A5022|nr:methyltransferase domain-containing protein [Schlesneria paludicola]